MRRPGAMSAGPTLCHELGKYRGSVLGLRCTTNAIDL